MFKLSYKDIKARMVELRNIRKLHQAARQRVEILEAENKNLKLRVSILEAENKDLRHELSDIKYQLTELQTIIFKKKAESKEISSFDNEDPKPSLPRSNESYKRPIPKDSEVTKTVRFTLKRTGNRTQNRTRTRFFYTEDIPLDIKKIITKYEVEQEYVGKSWLGKIPLPTAPVTLGNNVRMLVATLITIERLSHKQVRDLLRMLFQIHISEGEIGNILESESRNLKTTYQSMKESIQKEDYHHLDETGWRIKGEPGFAWSMTGKSGDTVYDLGKSRGKGVAEDLRGNSDGVLISDDYGVYQLLAEHHQLCFAHLLRKFRDIASHEDFTDQEKIGCSRHYHDLKLIYSDLKDTLRKDNPLFHKDSFIGRFQVLAKESSLDPKPLARIKATLLKNISKYLTCLSYPSIPLTNNEAERSLRHLVIKRKISFGSASKKGAENLSILLSVLLSLYRMDPTSYFQKYGEMRSV